MASSGTRGTGPTAPRGAAASAPRPNPGSARRGGYGARARHRAAAPGAATSGAARQPRSLSSLLIALGDLPRIVLSCIGWSVAGANSHSRNWASATVSARFRTKGGDGGRHRRRRQVNRACCLVPLAAPLPGSGDPIGGTFLGRPRWVASLPGTVAAGLCYTLDVEQTVQKDRTAFSRGDQRPWAPRCLVASS